MHNRNSAIAIVRRRRLGLSFLVAGACIAPLTSVFAGPSQGTKNAGRQTLRAVVIVSRHGVRAPTSAPERYASYSSDPWPQWSVRPGDLTPRGKRLMTLLGTYYRERYIADGLLSGRPEEDRNRIYFRSNNYERTEETARGLALGLDGDTSPELHALPADQADALFMPEKLPVGHPDRALEKAAMLARMGSDPARFLEAYRAEFHSLRWVLFGVDAAPPGKKDLLALPTVIHAKENLIASSGPLSRAMTFTENFVLEYAEGLPRAEVGWGRVTRQSLPELLQLHAAGFDLTEATFYPAQVQASNLAYHIYRTLEQGATGQPVAGAIGPPTACLTILVGHDTNLANLAGLLGLWWSVDGLPMNFTLPGGALVFELWDRGGNEGLSVRTYYIAQTLDQMREERALSLQSPPAISNILVTGCGTAGRDFEAPWAAFVTHLRKAIDLQFVAPDGTGAKTVHRPLEQVP